VERPLVVAVAMFGGYLASARMLWPLRAELDVPSRARVLLRARSGRVSFEHTLVPMAAAAVAAAAGVVAALIAGASDAGVALVVVAVAPLLTLSAAASARRGGRVPQSLLVTAIAADPTGGATAMAGWFAWWPAVAVATGTIALTLAESGATRPAAAWTIASGSVLAWLARRDVAAT
jgi:hypothetical protein